jgi:O-antigen ligase
VPEGRKRALEIESKDAARIIRDPPIFTLMLSKLWREWRFPVEFALLLALAFFLPLREAPKNIFWVAYVVTWVVNRAFQARGARDFGGPWGRWDTLFAAWIASGYAAALFAGIHSPDHDEWTSVNDLVRYVSLGWCVRRAGYTRAQALLVLAMLAMSASFGTVEALWRWKVSHAKKALELMSVGHVNHSAIYLAICAGITAGLLGALWRMIGRAWRVLLGAAALLQTIAILMTASRAAFVAVLPLLVLCAFFSIRANGYGGRAWAAVLAALVLALALGGVGSVDRHVTHTLEHNITAERDLIWNRALVAVRAHPWFGVGMDNFSRITDERLQQWLSERGVRYEPNEYRRAPHAHSLYFNTLTERGAIGIALLLVLLAAWALRLWRRRPQSGDDAGETALWCAAFSGWFVTVLIGVANTTMHHEHAILAVLTLSLWLARPSVADVTVVVATAIATPAG